MWYLQGHHFVRQVVQNATERDRPLRLYICTRKPPPTGELERFVRAHEPQSHSGPHKLAPESPRTNNVELRHVPLDLLDPTSIRNCASAFLAQETKLDVLVLNAAIAPNKRESAGFVVPPLAERNEHSNEEPRELEKGMITNVIGTAMLAKLLEPALIKAAKDGEEKPRVVLVSSELHRKLGDLEGKF
jgi:NAD(P)-dependent dehydrogenase (short-subunit alcohol dehydrogenase family)